MKLTIANNTLTLTNQTGTKHSMNITYGSYVYDKSFGYIELKDIRNTPLQLRIEQITELNGVVGQPTYAQLVTLLDAETQA